MLLSRPGLITACAAPVLELAKEVDFALATGRQYLREVALLFSVPNWMARWSILALLKLIKLHVPSHAQWVMKYFITIIIWRAIMLYG